MAEQQLQVVTAPVSAVQFPVMYNAGTILEGGAVGSFHPAETGKFIEDVTGMVYEINLSVIKSFLVQMMPGYNPVLLLVFDTNSNPKVNEGLHFLCTMGSEWLLSPTAAPFFPNFDVSLSYGQRSANTFGPFELPPDHRYFRAYVLERNNSATSLRSQVIKFTYFDLTKSVPWVETFSFVTVYGK